MNSTQTNKRLESVADYCQKPLLRLDAGTLGTSPKSVEEGLKNAFNLAERWHALLLLDEADVYLEQRRSRNLTHNGVISGKPTTECPRLASLIPTSFSSNN
jgi:hypothetical protein